MSLRKVLRLLGSLSPGELEEVEKAVKAMKGLSAPVIASGSLRRPGEPGNGEIDAEIIVQEVSATMTDMGVEFTPPGRLKASPQYKSFMEKAPDVLRFLRRAGKTRVEQRALLRMGIKLLYENMTKAGYPTSSRTIMAHLHRLPAVFNQHFPGYARSGMLSMLLKKENADVREEPSQQA